MATQHQVIKFVLVQFKGDWNRSFSPTAGVIYKAVAPGGAVNKLTVVKEVPGTGNAITYHFDLKTGDEVCVIEDVIHVPALCATSEQGNTVKCGH